jgi:hypothetical protein
MVVPTATIIPKRDKSTGQILINALPGQVKYHFTSPIIRLTRHIEIHAGYYPSYSTAKHALSLSSPPHASNNRLELALISWSDLGRPFPEPG